MKAYAAHTIEAVAADNMLVNLVRNAGMAPGIVAEWLLTPNDKLGDETPWRAWCEYQYEAFAHAASDLTAPSAMMSYPDLMLAP